MQKKSSSQPFSNSKQLRILGIGKQEIIKYFFGGNAFISILALIFITVLLGKEALFFFPEYKSNLEVYRKSGKEFSDLIEEQLKFQKSLKSKVTKVKQYELYHRAGVDAYIPELYASLKSVSNTHLRAELLALKIAKKRLSSNELLWSIQKSNPDRSIQSQAIQSEQDAQIQLQKAQNTLSDRAKSIIPSLECDNLPSQFHRKAALVKAQSPKALKVIKEALIAFYSNYSTSSKTPSSIEKRKKLGQSKRTKLLTLPFFKNLTSIEKNITKSYVELDTFVQDLRDQTLLVSNRAEAYRSSQSRKKAIEEGIPEASEIKKMELTIALKRLITDKIDYDSLAHLLYQTKSKHASLIAKTHQQTLPNLELLPSKEEITSKEAKRVYAGLSESVEQYSSFFEDQNRSIQNWRHDQPVHFLDAIVGFFLGDKWIANSSWQNFFGLVPLFGGSLFITIIAISLATPFSIGAAIYVNRIAGPTEQNCIKPVIEFIQAIPSVVLAFLGILVVGQNILKLSLNPYFSWVPGFPAQGEQMMLTAAFLLAFMAIPTMFTLAEDAINNVPKSYYEASLALGATRLQTIFQIILPCSLSGVVAAVILGFGRIIGETMVVLLVAGGSISWPATWTDPVHTMTGIIAQSTGEAAPGSIQYRSLFLIGLVLFLISLFLNSLAQKVIYKFGTQR